MMKKILNKSVSLLITSLTLLFIGSCTVGLGEAIDTETPTIEITYPPKNAIVRDTFVASGNCDDDLALEHVEVTVTNTATKTVYGPYTATLSKDKKSWSVSLNQKASGNYDVYNSWKQWEYPDGDYIINAVAYDKDSKKSQEAAAPVSIDNTA